MICGRFQALYNIGSHLPSFILYADWQMTIDGLWLRVTLLAYTVKTRSRDSSDSYDWRLCQHDKSPWWRWQWRHSHVTWRGRTTDVILITFVLMETSNLFPFRTKQLHYRPIRRQLANLPFDSNTLPSRRTIIRQDVLKASDVLTSSDLQCHVTERSCRVQSVLKDTRRPSGISPQSEHDWTWT